MPGQKFHMGRAEWKNHIENYSEVFQNNPISMTTLGDKLIPFVEWPHTRSFNEMSIFHLGRIGGFSSSCWNTLHPKSNGINPFWNRIIKWAPHLVHPVESEDKFYMIWMLFTLLLNLLWGRIERKGTEMKIILKNYSALF